MVILAPRWTAVRFVLGIVQMAGAVASLLVLVAHGVGPLALAAAAATTLVTVVSRVLFPPHPGSS